MKKLLLIPIAFALIFIMMSSCKKERPGTNKVVEVTLAPNQVYTYQIPGLGDRDDVVQITKAASHALVSKISTTINSPAITFDYTPALNYSGTDEVVITAVEPAKQGGGKGGKCGHHQNNDDQYTFRITIKGGTN